MFFRNGVDKFMTYVFLASPVLQSAALTFFTHEVFGIPIKKTTAAVYASALAVPYLAYLMLPYGAMDAQWVYVSMAPMLMSLVTAARSRRVRENPYNLLYLFIITVMMFWYPVQKILLTDTLFMPGVATNLFLILTQCLVLSLSYAEAKRQEEELSRKADFYHRIAHELLTPLTIVSTNVQVANQRKETDHERLKGSQTEIMKMATMINEALTEGYNREGEGA
jgi:signal transduction histidine kinase